MFTPKRFLFTNLKKRSHRHQLLLPIGTDTGLPIEFQAAFFFLAAALFLEQASGTPVWPVDTE